MKTKFNKLPEIPAVVTLWAALTGRDRLGHFPFEEVGKMRVSELVPGEDSLEDVNIWGIYHIKNLVDVMEDVLDSSPLVDEGLDPAQKKRLL